MTRAIVNIVLSVNVLSFFRIALVFVGSDPIRNGEFISMLHFGVAICQITTLYMLINRNFHDTSSLW